MEEREKPIFRLDRGFWSTVLLMVGVGGVLAGLFDYVDRSTFAIGERARYVPDGALAGMGELSECGMIFPGDVGEVVAVGVIGVGGRDEVGVWIELDKIDCVVVEPASEWVEVR